MTYDFNAPVDRTHNFSAKYDELEKNFGRTDLIPLWIADMDLPAAQPIVEAIAQRNQQAIYGYTSRPASYFEAVCDWQLQRNGWHIDKSLVSFSLGVVPTLATLVKELTAPGDRIAFFTPVYSEFFDVVRDWGRIPLTSTLAEQEGHYTVDFDTFETLLQQKPTMLILCNPHNPVGRVWKQEELERIGKLCLEQGVLVVSDEIHSDLILPGHKHIPFVCVHPSFAANTITCISATKTFNLAGLQASTVVFPDLEKKQKYDAFWSHLDVHRNNCFSLVAVEAAFRQGGEWLDQLLVHLQSNMEYVQNFLAQNIPQIRVRLPECTYLMWLDCRGLGLSDPQLHDFMFNQARLALNRGTSFGEGGQGFMRMNVACPRSTLEKAMRQLQEAVANLA